MAKFIFKKRIGKRSRKDNKSFISYPTIKKPVYSIVFQNENTGNFFEIEDTAIMKHKRNKMIIQFFEKYSNQKKYQLFEFGLPFDTTENVGIIIQKIKRRFDSIDMKVLGYIWVYDVGEENFGAHYHIVVSTLKLNDYKYPSQAGYHFISGYTAKVAGTEAGVTEPIPVFSACFGAPFMPLQPTKYAEMLSKKIKEANTNVWLINTGWTGGKYGIGRRIPLKQTRAMINALQNLENVLKFHRDC
jgi:hypothetical protein